MIDTPFALLFDMDGVIVDNLTFHVDAWLKFCEQHELPLTREEFYEKLNGRNTQDTINYLFRKEIEPAEADRLGEEKELIYRNSYAPFIKPLNGLVDLLKSLKNNGIKMAVATSASIKNIEFTLEHTQLGPYFDVVVESSMIKSGKPAPDIYLKAAELLNMPAEKCIVAEDAIQGIQAGLNAGMKVIGITTSHSATELAHTDIQVADFSAIKFDLLIELINK